MYPTRALFTAAACACGLTLVIQGRSSPEGMRADPAMLAASVAPASNLRAMPAGSAELAQAIYLPLVFAPRPSGFDLIGQIGGAMRSPVVKGRWLYVGIGPRLAVFSLDLPGEPELVGLSDVLPEVVRAIAVQGQHAYIGFGGEAWVQVVDISEASRPRHIGSLPGVLATHLTATDRHLFAAESHIVILDLAQPEAPRSIGTFKHWAFWDDELVAGITVLADVLYAEYFSGTLIIDVSDPTAPRLRDIVSGPRCCLGIGRGHGFADTAGSTVVWRLDDPAAPVEVGRGDGCEHRPVNGAVDGRRLYLVCAGDRYQRKRRALLKVIDISDPTRPILSSVLGLTDFGAGMLAPSGRYLYVTGDNGLTVLDVTRKDTAREVFDVATLSTLSRLAVVGDRVLAADNAGRRLWGIEIGDPTLPRVTNAAQLPGPASRVLASEGIAFVGGSVDGSDKGRLGLEGYVSAFDLTRPESFAELGRLTDVPPPDDLALADPFLYFAPGVGPGIRIVDVSRPEQLHVAAVFAEAEESFSALLIQGDTLFTTSAFRPSGQPLFDVRDPLHPVARGRLPVGVAYAVAASGGTAYVGTGARTVAIDISNLDQPRHLGEHGRGVSLTDSRMVVDGTLLYRGAYCLGVDDVGDPAQPSPIHGICLPGTVTDLAVAGGDVLVAGDDAGLLILRAVDP